MMTPQWTRRDALARLATFLAGSPLLSAQLVQRSEHQRIPSLNELASVFEFEPIARAKITRTTYDFVAGGVESEFTLQRNRQAFDWMTLLPRAMEDVSSLDLSVQVLGQRLDSPILVAPSSGHQLLHRDAEIATHQGASAARAVMVVTTYSSYPISKIAAAAEGPLWFQLYHREGPERARERVDQAQEAGCRAVCLTVDAPYRSHRERLGNDRHLNTPIRSASRRRARRRRRAQSAPPLYGLERQNPALDWSFVETLRSWLDVPLLLKGVLTVEDTRLAVEHGVDGIVVSNHGGRYLEYAPSTVEVLAEIVDAAAGRLAVLIDSGFRRGSDVFKALALGARAVLVGRPPLWGLAAFGAAGVQRVLEILQTELALTMAQTGCRTIPSIHRSLVRTDFP